jgi:hypothetical protein
VVPALDADRSRPVRPIGLRLVLMLVIVAALGVAELVIRLRQLSLVSATPPRIDRWLDLDDDADAFTGLQLWFVPGTVLLLALWSRRCAANVRSFGAPGPSPRVAAAAWLVPLANVPIQMRFLHRIWRSSDPDTVGGDQRRGRPSALPFVWLVTTGVAFTLFTLRPDRRRTDCDTAEELGSTIRFVGEGCEPVVPSAAFARSTSRWDIAVCALLILAAVLGAAAVWTLTRLQTRKRARFHELPR